MRGLVGLWNEPNFASQQLEHVEAKSAKRRVGMVARYEEKSQGIGETAGEGREEEVRPAICIEEETASKERAGHWKSQEARFYASLKQIAAKGKIQDFAKVTRDQDQAGKEQCGRHDDGKTLEAGNSQGHGAKHGDGDAFSQAVPEELLVALDAKEHGLNAALRGRDADSESEKNQEAVGNGILRTDPQREQFLAEDKEKSGERSEQQEGALNAHLNEFAELGEVVAGFELAGERIHDFSHGADAFSGEGEDFHGEGKNGYGDWREKAGDQDGVNVAAHSFGDADANADGAVAEHVAKDGHANPFGVKSEARMGAEGERHLNTVREQLRKNGSGANGE